MGSSLNLLVFILIITGIIILHIYLSKRENKWLGLTFPGISLLFSFLMVLNIVVPSNESIAQITFLIIRVFLLFNIPTVILIAIYFACREKLKKRKQIEKMNIQDLE